MIRNLSQWLVLLICFSLGLSEAEAKPHNIVKLNDGSTLKGDIIVQRPGFDITVYANEASFVINDNNVVSQKEYKTPFEKLPRELMRWALENNALEGDAYGRFLTLEDIHTGKYSLRMVIKSKDPHGSKRQYGNVYLQVVPSTYKIKWNDVKEIQRIDNSQTGKTGLFDEITTFSGKRYIGKITSQHPGKDITIHTDEGYRTLNPNEIKELKKYLKKGAKSWKGETDYVNILVLKNGENKRGLILAHHFEKNGKGNYLSLLTDNNQREKISVTDVEEYHTEYDVIDKEIYREGDVYVNEFRIKPASVMSDKDIKGFTDNKVYTFPEGIHITFKTPGPKFQGVWSLIALEDVTLNGSIKTKGYNSIIKDANGIKPSSTDMAEGISSLNFVYLSPGYYALVNGDESESYIIKIVK